MPKHTNTPTPPVITVKLDDLESVGAYIEQLQTEVDVYRARAEVAEFRLKHLWLEVNTANRAARASAYVPRREELMYILRNFYPFVAKRPTPEQRDDLTRLEVES